MALRDPVQRAEDTLAVLLRHLAGELDPLTLDRRQALPAPPVLLAQSRVEDDRQLEPLAHDLGGLARPGKVARIDRVEVLIRQLFGGLPRLPPAEIAQRPVGVAMEATVGVPVGLAVANEQQSRHDSL